MRKRYLLTGVWLLLFLNLPYVIALAITDQKYMFGGFLLNPVDGYTYLAKILQGRLGNWLFTLPYSAEPNQGAPIFWFYLLLGHLSRWLNVSPVFTFHLARFLSSIALLVSLKSFFERLFANKPQIAFWAYLMAVLGSGCGWLASLAGIITSDFWVAEAYPFLAMYSSPHFSLGLALLIWFVSKLLIAKSVKTGWILSGAGLLLSIVLPFGIVIAALVAFGDVLISIALKEKAKYQTIIAFLLPGGLFILYQFFIIRTDPVLAQWDAQNLTVSPPVWDILVSFSPLLVFAVYGGVKTFIRRHRPLMILTVWLVLGLLLIYVPFNLQRRFMLGYMIPVAGLAAYGISEVKFRWKRPLRLALLIAALPTIFIVILGGLMAVRNSDPRLVINRDEMDAFVFLVESSGCDDLILASPETGLLIPAFTGRRVIYGHPFETVDGAKAKIDVEAFFNASMNAESVEWAREKHVKWVFWGPREHDYGKLPDELPKGLLMLYQNESVRLFGLQDKE